MAEQTVIRQPGEGEAFWMLGGLYEVKAAGGETNGAATVMEMTIPEGMGPPPHRHPGAEAVYVLEGTVNFHIGDDVVKGGAGSFVYIPAGTLERFEPTSTARVLVMYLPGGMEEFFAEAGEPATRRDLPPRPEGEPDVERLAAIGNRYGIEMAVPGGT
jgi:quercetin dioxygenase-like cupin family protein